MPDERARSSLGVMPTAMTTRSASGGRNSRTAFENVATRKYGEARLTDNLAIVELEPLEDLYTLATLQRLYQHVLDINVGVDLDSQRLDSTEDHLSRRTVELSRERVRLSVDNPARVRGSLVSKSLSARRVETAGTYETSLISSMSYSALAASSPRSPPPTTVAVLMWS